MVSAKIIVDAKYQKPSHTISCLTCRLVAPIASIAANSLCRFKMFELMVLMKFKIPIEKSTNVKKADNFDIELLASDNDSANSIFEVREMAGISSVNETTWLRILCSYSGLLSIFME